MARPGDVSQVVPTTYNAERRKRLVEPQRDPRAGADAADAAHLVTTTTDASRALTRREVHAPAPDAMVRQARRRLVRTPVRAPAQAAGGQARGATVHRVRLRRLVPGGAGPWALCSSLSSRQIVALPASLAPAPASFGRSKRSAFTTVAVGPTGQTERAPRLTPLIYIGSEPLLLEG
jgi:hypothetical protein